MKSVGGVLIRGLAMESQFSGRVRPFGLGSGAGQKEQIPLRFAPRNDKGLGKGLTGQEV
jgi:hypothetical protein